MQRCAVPSSRGAGLADRRAAGGTATAAAAARAAARGGAHAKAAGRCCGAAARARRRSAQRGRQRQARLLHCLHHCTQPCRIEGLGREGLRLHLLPPRLLGGAAPRGAPAGCGLLLCLVALEIGGAPLRPAPHPARLVPLPNLGTCTIGGQQAPKVDHQHVPQAHNASTCGLANSSRRGCAARLPAGSPCRSSLRASPHAGCGTYWQAAAACPRAKAHRRPPRRPAGRTRLAPGEQHVDSPRHVEVHAPLLATDHLHACVKGRGALQVRRGGRGSAEEALLWRW